MRFASLGSGSRGNATLVATAHSLVLLDCGFSCRDTERRMQRLGCDPADIDAILVTHEHSDHVRGVPVLARKYGLPVWMTRGTGQMLRDAALPDINFYDGHSNITVGDLQLNPFTVPHDAREPCQLTIGSRKRLLGILTDTGRMTPHIVRQLAGCDALLLECNHDAGLLEQGPYPAALKRRVGGPLGHLSNGQAAGILSELECERLQHLVAVHLSEQNNRPELARAALAAVTGGDPGQIDVASQEHGLGWREIV